MRKTSVGLVVVALLATTVLVAGHTAGNTNAFGPPAWVVEAWENGEGFDLPGPPDWVVEGAEGPGFGPPAWVVEAWENGQM
jgi:hypothetical protein